MLKFVRARAPSWTAAAIVMFHPAAFPSAQADCPAPVQVQLRPASAVADQTFAGSMALDGDIALFGAPYEAVAPAPASGAAYVFFRTGQGWTQQARLAADDASEGALFGAAIGIHGTTVLIGAPDESLPDLPYAGRAFIFTLADGAWIQRAVLSPIDTAGWDHFGHSTDIDADTALVGAVEADHSGRLDPGAAYVFVRDGAAWTQQARLIASDPGTSDAFGAAVALDGDTALIGAFDDDNGNGRNAGSAYVFNRMDGVWQAPVKLLANDGAQDDYFGYAVALSGDTAVVGAYGNGEFGIGAGAAYVFERAGGAWTGPAKLIAPDAAPGDGFGYALSVHHETLLVGAYQNDAPVRTDAGAAYVFARDGAVWARQGKLVADDAAAYDNLGQTVALFAGTALIGAPAKSYTGRQKVGAAYAFQLDCDANGRADCLDLAGGAADVDGNGILDVCESACSPPAVALQPTSVSTCQGRQVVLQVGAEGTPPPTYRWRRGGVGLPGATQATLTFDSAEPQDADQYDVIIQNECGFVVSDAATLLVWPMGTGDVNGDGLLNAHDIAALLAVSTAFPPEHGDLGFCAADMNGDGALDALDTPLFVAALLGG